MLKQVSIVVMTAALATMGCDKKSESKKTSDKVGGVAAGVAEKADSAPAGAVLAAAGKTSRPATLDGILSLMPADAQMVFGVGIEKLAQSPLLAGKIDEVLADASKDFDLKAACGIDMKASLKQVVIAAKGQGDEPDEFVIGAMGLPKKQVMDCMPKLIEEAKKEGTTITVDGDYVFGDAGADEGKFGMTFIGDNVAVMLGRAKGKGAVDKAMMDTWMATPASAGLMSSSQFKDMYGKINTAHTVWFAVNGAAPQFKASPVKFKAAFGSIDVTAGVGADVRVRTNSDAEAAEIVKGMGSQVSQLKAMGFADKSDVTAQGADVRIEVGMTKEQIEKLVEMAGPMIGGMLGGM